MDDLWEKRDLFKQWVADAKTKLGATNNADVAPIMGITESSLNKYLGKSETHKPSPDKLKLLGDFLGRDYRLLLNNPGCAPSGLSATAWAEASNRTRVLASAMFEDLLQFPEGEQDEYYKLWKQGVQIGLARRQAEGVGKKGAKKP